MDKSAASSNIVYLVPAESFSNAKLGQYVCTQHRLFPMLAYPVLSELVSRVVGVRASQLGRLEDAEESWSMGVL